MGKETGIPIHMRPIRGFLARLGDSTKRTEYLASRDPLYWAQGRLVAIRPDGARRSFDPGAATHVLRTDAERALAKGVLHDLYSRVAANGGYPEWYHKS